MLIPMRTLDGGVFEHTALHEHRGVAAGAGSESDNQASKAVFTQHSALQIHFLLYLLYLTMKCDGPFPHARGSACCCGTARLGSDQKSAKGCKLITRLHRVQYYFRVARGFRDHDKETLLPRRAGAGGAGACEGEGRANSGGVSGRKLHVRRAPHDRAPAAGKGRPALHTKVRHTFSCSPDTCSCLGVLRASCSAF